VVCVDAEYAKKLQKPIAVLCMEDGYEPDGWLDPLCKSYYDFGAEEKFDVEWNKLYFKLFDVIASGRVLKLSTLLLKN